MNNIITVTVADPLARTPETTYMISWTDAELAGQKYREECQNDDALLRRMGAVDIVMARFPNMEPLAVQGCAA